MSLINETNQQYYSGSQTFMSAATDLAGQSFTTIFNTNLAFGSFDNTDSDYGLNNFKLYILEPGDLNYSEYLLPYTVVDNTITITGTLLANTKIAVQLKTETGGSYGDGDAYGTTVQKNWGEYQYIKLNDVINNFLIAYVGAGKLIPSVKRTDVIFHAKRAMQELSYDTLNNINSQELTVPSN